MSKFLRLRREAYSGLARSGRLAAAAVLILVAAALSVPAQAQPIRGSGSTFAFPVIAAWSDGFLRDRADGGDFVNNDAGVDYEPVGSLGGIMRLSQAEIDFAASDAPLRFEETTKRDLAQFPIVLGGIAPVVNLDGLEPARLKLTGAVIADIYLGSIERWNHPAIQAVNPGLALPDLQISVVHRSDGSGSTLAWTRFLSRASTDWRQKVGADTLVAWPRGADAKGSSGMIEAVAGTRGAIGYAEFGQILRSGLPFAQVQNHAGVFVTPGPEAFAATARAVRWDPDRDFYADLSEADAADAYPLTAATFILMHKRDRSEGRTLRTLYFLSYALDKGAKEAAALGYVPLPEDLAGQVKDYWRAALPGGAGL
ncbi:phosphate ABC transporter substrate-binding protein PstS [Inquilinus limosus]|uniref:phosphate ABC transporter substrate-binding protein PstS n=1 Tax=Inquilinus limosus TaxID=171674 RepID=UPI003F162B82